MVNFDHGVDSSSEIEFFVVFESHDVVYGSVLRPHMHLLQFSSKLVGIEISLLRTMFLRLLFTHD